MKWLQMDWDQWTLEEMTELPKGLSDSQMVSWQCLVQDGNSS